MAQQIYRVDVINQHEDGPDCYRVGSRLYPTDMTIHRIEDESLEYEDHVDRIYVCYDEAGNVLARIENCPAVVQYKPE